VQVLLTSDLHYTLPQLDWVASVAGDYDLVVLAGDHLDVGSIVEPDAQIAVMLEYLTRIAAKTSVVACSGNHDLNARNDDGERVARWLDGARGAGVLIDGMIYETDELMVTVCPWWDGPLTRDAVDRQLAHDAPLVGDRRWVWAYHAPPANSPTSWTGRRHYGDEDLVAWIGQYHPAFVLSGHVHPSPFVPDGAWIDQVGSTWVLNAGRQPGPKPSYIELDTDTGLARWTSYEGVDERSFAPA
jgi:Icc-related predicted phosphoesterase